MTTEQIQIKRDDLQPGDVVITSHAGNPWIEVEREVHPVEGTIAKFYNQHYVLLKRGRTLVAHAERHSGDPLVPGIGKDAEYNNKLIWVNVERGWAFREYVSTLDGLEPEIVFTPEVTKENTK